MTPERRSFHLNPLVIGIAFGLVGVILAVIGIARGNVPLNLASIAIALLISGGTWGLIAWAVATAAVDVETDIAEEHERGQ